MSTILVIDCCITLDQKIKEVFNIPLWVPFKNMNVEWMSKFVSQQFLDNTAALDRSIKAFSYSNLTLNYALRHVLGKEINFGIQVNNIFNYLYANNGYTFSYLYDGQ
jgi:iron complex outermembrane receptor protein